MNEDAQSGGDAPPYRTPEALFASVDPPSAAEPDAVRARLDGLTKPPGSLGRLEALAVRLAPIYGDPPPPLRRRRVYVLAADHGVARRGVSAYPAGVTAQMCRVLADGGAAVDALAGAVDAEVVACDVGVDAPGRIEARGLIDARVRRGSRDLSREAALTGDEVARAVLRGAGLLSADPGPERRREGRLVGRVERDKRLPDLVALGEVGIGNTTPATALAGALTGRPARALVGRGTGVDDAGIERKRRAIESALGRIGIAADPLTLLAELGGLEIAGLVGLTAAAAGAGRAVVTDGLIATAAAAIAVEASPAVRPYLFASHRSPEPAHEALLEQLGLRPLFDLGLRLGEGTGAALALPLLDAAGSVLREMASFGEAGVSGPAGRGPG